MNISFYAFRFRGYLEEISWKQNVGVMSQRADGNVKCFHGN